MLLSKNNYSHYVIDWRYLQKYWHLLLLYWHKSLLLTLLNWIWVRNVAVDYSHDHWMWYQWWVWKMSVENDMFLNWSVLFSNDVRYCKARDCVITWFVDTWTETKAVLLYMKRKRISVTTIHYFCYILFFMWLSHHIRRFSFA